MTVRESQAHLHGLYCVEVVSPDLISRVFDAVLEEIRDWQNRPLGGIYAPAVTAEAGEIARLVETRHPALVLLDTGTARHRRHRADADPAGARRPAGDL